MPFVDLGNPIGPLVVGSGSEELAKELGPNYAATLDAEEYSDWVGETMAGVAHECGARAVEHSVGSRPTGSGDDFGEIWMSGPSREDSR